MFHNIYESFYVINVIRDKFNLILTNYDYIYTSMILLLQLETYFNHLQQLLMIKKIA